MNDAVILVTGASGQIGTELVKALQEKYGREKVIASDLRGGDSVIKLDVLDFEALCRVVDAMGVTHIYHLAALLSASSEKNPMSAWNINMAGLLNVLEVARIRKLKQVFWPSSIAVFGKHATKEVCAQHTITQPATIYGISKAAGENLCQYYFEQYGLDVRSLRYPGLISHSAQPGGGTTDYAVEIFHEAILKNSYTCFLKYNTRLPMLYMADAVKATLALMAAPVEAISVRTSYNLAGTSFTPAELGHAIENILPDFKLSYAPDFRQQIADSWPSSIDDYKARHDWGWEAEYDLDSLVQNMMEHLQDKALQLT